MFFTVPGRVLVPIDRHCGVPGPACHCGTVAGESQALNLVWQVPISNLNFGNFTLRLSQAHERVWTAWSHDHAIMIKDLNSVAAPAATGMPLDDDLMIVRLGDPTVISATVMHDCHPRPRARWAGPAAVAATV
jgi:hypothetical protein